MTKARGEPFRGLPEPFRSFSRLFEEQPGAVILLDHGEARHGLRGIGAEALELRRRQAPAVELLGEAQHVAFDAGPGPVVAEEHAGCG